MHLGNVTFDFDLEWSSLRLAETQDAPFMRRLERSLQLQNVGYQKQETSEKEHLEQHVCHFQP